MRLIFRFWKLLSLKYKNVFQWDRPGLETCTPSWPSPLGLTECWTIVSPSRSSPCVVATCDLLGHTLVRWNRLWLRRLQDSAWHSDTHWLILSANRPLLPSHEANTIKGRMLPHIACLLSANIHQQISTTTSSQWVQGSVLPSLHTGLCCSNEAKHALVLGNLLNNAHWKLTCVTSIFHTACSVNCGMGPECSMAKVS